MAVAVLAAGWLGAGGAWGEDGVPEGAATYVDPTDGGVVKWREEWEGAGTAAWEDGKWYVAEGEAEVEERIKVSGSVNLILADGAKLAAKQGIRVNKGASLTIWGQKAGSGRLEATGPEDFAGIGGEWYKGGDGAESCHCGAVTINGGVVVAQGGKYGAGIGGSDTGDGGVVTVNGGEVEATGQEGSAGIGGGDYGNGGEFTITGGKVTATGSTRLTGNKGTGQASAGIGAGRPQIDKSDGTVASGDHLTSGKVTIQGGEVVAKAGVPSDQAAYNFADPAQAMGVNVKDADYNEEHNAGWLELREVAVYTSEDAAEPVPAAEREEACRGTNVWVRTCPHSLEGMICVWCGATVPPELPGKGTEEEPYLIGNYETLVAFGMVVNGTHPTIGGNTLACGRLTNDIVATGTDWTPIGNVDDGNRVYNGTFDGGGHVISGLSNEGVEGPPLYAGLFGYVYDGGTVRGVRVEGASFKGNYVGGIAGGSRGTVSTCCVTGQGMVRGDKSGGVVGANSGTVVDCFNTGKVERGRGVGGVVGENSGSSAVVSNCYNVGEFVGESGVIFVVGGVVGINEWETEVVSSHCLAGGDVKVVGDAYEGSIERGCSVLDADGFKNVGNFEGWDFENVWAMGPERPLLRVFGVPSSETVGETAWYYWTDADGGTNATVAGAWPAAGDLTMPATLGGRPVVGIGAGAFEGCGGLTGLRISDGVGSVGAGAFAGCTNLATVWVPVAQAGTGLLDTAGLPEGCEIRYYGTQVVTFDPAGGACATLTNAYVVGEPYGWLPEAKWVLHEFDGWWAPGEGAVDDPIDYDMIYDLVPRDKEYTAAPADSAGQNVCKANADEDFTIDWTVKNDPGTAGIEFYWDFSQIEYVSGKIGGFYRLQPKFDDTHANISKEEDPINGGQVSYFYDSTDSVYIANPGEAIYSFTVKAPSEEGIYSITQYDRKPSKVVPEDHDKPYTVLVHGLDIVVVDPDPEEPVVLAEVSTNSLGDPDPEEPVVLAEVSTNSLVTEEATRTLTAHWRDGVVANGMRWYGETNASGGVTVTGLESAAGDFTIPETLDGLPVTAVGADAFAGASNLTGLTVADGVTDIGDRAFADCGALTNVWLGTGIGSVGAGAFEGCTNLATVWVPVEQAGTGLLDAAELPEGCEIRYYGTQMVTFEAGAGTCPTATNAYVVGEPYGWLPVAEWDSLHEFEGWRAANGGVVTTNSIVTWEARRLLVAQWKTPRGVFITEQPEGRTVQPGESVTFSVGVRNQAGYRVHLGANNEVGMLFCPAGTFEMGSPESELGRGDNETRHTVILTQDFWLGKYEITQKQWEDGVMGTSPWDRDGSDLPADSVSWRDVEYFCLRLTADEKSAGRLPEGYVYAAPTEAQWEYACRAGTTNALASGEELSDAVSCPEMDQVGWYKSNSVAQTHVVGTIWTNAWGFCDMHGNVSEWCWDWYQAAYPTGTVVNPAGPGMTPGGRYDRVLRGGNWDSEAHKCRSAARGYNQPSHALSQYGFRLALVRSRDVTVPLADGLRLQLTAVNPDTFQMGSPDGELGRNTDETRHAVTLTQVYWIGKYEVTQAQWLNVMGGYPAAFTTNSADPAFHGMGDDVPVYATSHAEAVAFCERLTERERAAGRLPAGYRFALPTEAQWEYACRGGTTKALNDDNDLTATTGECYHLKRVGWYAYNAGGMVHSSDSDKEPNNAGRNGGGFEFGASMSHMHGNVQEWVADWYGEYPGGAVTEPAGPATGTERILRGGGITDEPPACRSAARMPVSGGAATETSGFRVAIVPVKGVPGDPDALYPPKEPWCLTGGVAYQWYRDGVAIEGETGASLSIDSAALSDAGRYTVTVTAAGESATSAEAVLAVAESETVDGVEWWYVGNGEGATVVGAVPAEGDLTIPATLGGAAVTEVGAGAFAGNTNLTGLTVADGVTDIGDRAFENCGALTNVWLGTGIGSVGAGAFEGCTNLATVWVPAEQAGTGLLDAAGLPEGCQVIYRGNQIRIMAIGVGSNAVSLQFNQDASTVFGTDDLKGEWKAIPRADFTLEGTNATIPLEKAYRFLRAE